MSQRLKQDVRTLIPLTVAAAMVILVACGQQAESGAAEKKATQAASVAEGDAAQAKSAKRDVSGEVALPPDAPELKEMSIEPVKAVPVAVDEVSATARIQANPHNVGHAVLPVPGRIVQVMKKLGDSVTRGQPLVAIESNAVADAEAAFVQAESGVRQAEITSSKAEADLVRLTDLLEHQAVAQKEVLAASTTAGLAKAAVEQARIARDQARRRLELLGLKAGVLQQHVVVNAPISGKVMEVNVVEGEFRNEINTPLITITDLSRVWVTSEVPESKIRLFRVGGIAHLDLIAYPGETLHARVTRIADSVDSNTRTVQVNAEVDNPGGKLRPDMFGSLRYDAGEAPSPWVPQTAVVRLNGVDLVFREVAAGRFRAVPVEIGTLTQGGYPILKGLTVGDRVVTKGSVYLKAAL